MNNIPTTEDVREVYEHVINGEDFDRWLANHDAEMAKATQERIITLLQDSQAEAVWCDADEECNHAVTCHDIEQWLDHVIFALIKGENE